MYRENYDGMGIVRIKDNAVIPENPLNNDWVEYLAWRGLAGNRPEPALPTKPVTRPYSPPTRQENLIALLRQKGIITLAEVIDL